IERHAARTGDAGWVGVLDRNGLDARGSVGAGIRGRPGAQDRVSAAATRVGYIGETNRDAAAGVRGGGYAGGIGPGIRRAIERHAARTGDAGWVGVLDRYSLDARRSISARICCGPSAQDRVSAAATGVGYI